MFTVPHGDFVDVGTRKLFHAEFKTNAIDFNTRKVKLSPKLLQYNAQNKKFYNKFLRYIKKGGGTLPITHWKVGAPSGELIKAYERKKGAFTTELNHDIMIELDKIEAKKNEKPLTEFQEGILDCWNKGVVIHEEIGEILGRRQVRVSENIKWMLNKGYVPDLSKKRQKNGVSVKTTPLI